MIKKIATYMYIPWKQSVPDVLWHQLQLNQLVPRSLLDFFWALEAFVTTFEPLLEVHDDLMNGYFK